MARLLFPRFRFSLASAETGKTNAAHASDELAKSVHERVNKRRIDQLLVERGLASSRQQAQALVMSGRVWMGEQRLDKSGAQVPEDAAISVQASRRFVSRGGEKLDGALEQLGLDVAELVAADIGASTGGFTDCLLKRGARKVYAVDVGHGQLAQQLRDDPRVVVREGTNARHLKSDSLGEAVDLVVVDASFISLTLLLEAVANLLKPGGRLVALIKPQFEVGKREASRHRGVIRDERLRQSAIEAVQGSITDHGFALEADCPSVLKGPKGNHEHFVLARKPGEA